MEKNTVHTIAGIKIKIVGYKQPFYVCTVLSGNNSYEVNQNISIHEDMFK
jgi:hypothetical protein